MMKERIRIRSFIPSREAGLRESQLLRPECINLVRRISGVNCCPSGPRLQSTFGHGRPARETPSDWSSKLSLSAQYFGQARKRVTIQLTPGTIGVTCAGLAAFAWD